MDELISYFAYGSNMSVERLRRRVPSAVYIGIAKLANYTFSCNKRSSSGSGKGNICAQENAITWGVVYQIPISDISKLDNFEKGYSRVIVNVHINEAPLSCITYQSDRVTSDRPFGWYMHYILTGALDFNLPNKYLEFLADIPVKKDVTKHNGIATYKEIQTWVKAKYSFVPQTCWIAHAKEIFGLPVSAAPNRIGENRIKPCPSEKIDFIRSAFLHFGMTNSEEKNG